MIPDRLKHTDLGPRIVEVLQNSPQVLLSCLKWIHHKLDPQHVIQWKLFVKTMLKQVKFLDASWSKKFASRDDTWLYFDNEQDAQWRRSKCYSHPRFGINSKYTTTKRAQGMVYQT
ncbi:MAG: hypothetical protein EZS28_019303 [Streblomastix strix]|uniref:Uncharacterized protein n=1 Tax=Streblomastix strix TaxID=222440 RepID=A0A5J4VR56_9EUKA|nr:MAG: hypothetical protein EZS28_019303 [Streblomastix strix]